MNIWQKKTCLTTLLGLLLLIPGSPAWGQVEAPVEVAPVETAPDKSTPAETAPKETNLEAPLVQSGGMDDLDEALRIKATSEGIRDLNRAIELLEIALDKGLDAEDNAFAEQMLSDALMERATTLMQVINTRSIADQRVQKIRQLVISDLRSVLDYNEPPPVANFMLAKLMALPGGDPREARRAVKSFLQAEKIPNEQRAEALVLRARLSKDQTKALADMETAIQLAPENTSYRLARAIFLRQADKLDEALEAIEENMQLNPTDANAAILQGEIYRQQKRLEEALASFDKATELAPQAPGPYQNRGEIYREQEEYDQSIAQFTKVLELQPGVLLTLIRRSESYLANGQFESALADIEVVLEKQPLVTAHRLRAEILAKMDRLDEEIEEIERLAAAMPDQADKKMQLALYYLVDQQHEQAIVAYSDVLQQNNENFSALQSRGDAYLNVGDHAGAIADFNRALELQPRNTALLNNLAWVLATSPVDALRDGKRAVQLATQACDLTDYKTPHVLSTLAAAFAEEGNFETAIKWSQQAVDLDDPDNGQQLAKELASYREGQPWRENQNIEEQTTPEPLEETPQNDQQPIKR